MVQVSSTNMVQEHYSSLPASQAGVWEEIQLMQQWSIRMKKAKTTRRHQCLWSIIAVFEGKPYVESLNAKKSRRERHCDFADHLGSTT
jgi:hypothetical protein